jgi:hypothetical protein
MPLLLTVVGSAVVAAGLAYLELRYKMRPARLEVYDTVRNGIWITHRRGEGSAEALRIHRARIARHTGFGMNRREAIYWGTSVDSTGEPLHCSRTYRIDGVDPDTRWWCMTVYQDQFFIPNPLDRYSFSKTDVQRNPDDSWTIKVSAEEQPGSWCRFRERHRGGRDLWQSRDGCRAFRGVLGVGLGRCDVAGSTILAECNAVRIAERACHRERLGRPHGRDPGAWNR